MQLLETERNSAPGGQLVLRSRLSLSRVGLYLLSMRFPFTFQDIGAHWDGSLVLPAKVLWLEKAAQADNNSTFHFCYSSQDGLLRSCPSLLLGLSPTKHDY